LLAWMRMIRLLTLSGLILLLAALAAAPASAGVREKILRECQEGRITGDYTPGQLRDARKNIPTDIDEYSDCRDVLSRAALAGRGGGSGGGSAAPGGVQPGGGGGNLTYANGKAEEQDLVKALKDAPGGATVAGDHLVPGASGLAADAARHGLPTSLLTALILTGLCALAAAAPAVRRRVLARRKP
jgi:hypothetical protein